MNKIIALSLAVLSVIFSDCRTHTYYTVSYCRYFLDGTIITSDGMKWGYETDSISGQKPYNNMPVIMTLDDNGTPDIIEDDIVLNLVFDEESTTELNHNVRIQSIKIK